MSWGIGIIESVKNAVAAAVQAKLKADIQAAEAAVQTAAKNFRNNRADTNKKAYIDALDNLLVLVAYDLRKLNTTDPTAIDAEIARVKADYQGTQKEKDILFPLLDQVASQVKAETPEQRALQVKIHDAIDNVQKTQGDVEGAKGRLDGFGTGPVSNPRMADARSDAQYELGQAQASYSVAVANLMGLELEFELTKVKPAGPNGTYTAAQWAQAGDAVKKRYGATGEFAAFIDQLGLTKGSAKEVQAWLDKITKDPASLNLTPAEQDLARTDPVSLAFLKATGIKLDLNDSNLSPEMKEIAKADPVLFGLLRMSGANIWTDGTPPEGAQALTVSGKYIYITIGNNTKPLLVTQEMAQQFQIGGPTALATMLIPQLKLDKNPIFMRLAPGTDMVRADYVDQQMKLLMTGANPQTDAAIKMLGVNLPQFFSPGARAATWETSGRPHLEPVFRNGLDQIKFDKNGMDPFLTGIAQYMNQHLNGAAPEVASLLLDLVMGRVDTLGKQAFDAGQVPTGQNSTFYDSLSRAVQLADQLPGAAPTEQEPGVHAKKVADWMVNYEYFSLVNLNTSSVASNDIRNTGNTFLADALIAGIHANQGQYVSGFADDFQAVVAGAKDELDEDLLERLNKQAYMTFMENPAEILEPFFDGFLNDPRIGRKITVTSDTELRNIIGKTLKLDAANTEGAKNLDYSVEWYTEGTAEWNKIMTIFDLIRLEGGTNPTLTALPMKYVSKKHAVNTGALFIVIKPDGDDVVIDGTAALSAVEANGGQRVNADQFHSSWKFDDFTTFQEDNYYDDHGTLYIPLNFNLADLNNDGHADYESKDAAITTAGERARMGVSIAGALLMFVPSAQGAGLLLLAAGGYMSIKNLNKMEAQGQSTSWSNPAARAEYMNLIGTGAVFLRFGAVGLGMKATTAGWTKSASFLRGSQRFLGVGATYVGLTQTVGHAQYLALNWGKMDWGERSHGMLMLAAGLTQMRFGAKELNPRLGHLFRLDPVAAPRGASWRMNQQINKRADELWIAAGRPQGQLGTYKTQAWQEMRTNAINQRADDLWVQAGNPQGSKPLYVTRATQEFNTKVDQLTETMWQNSGQPAGKKQDYRDSAEYAVFENAVLQPMSPGQRLHTWAANLPPRAGENLQQLRTDWANRHGGNNPKTIRDYWQNIRTDLANRRANPSPTYTQGWKDFLAQSKTVLKWVGTSYAIVNGVALVLEGVWYFGSQERPKDPNRLTKQNAEDEMKAFLANPDQYLEANYENAFFGWGIGNRGYNLNGHLLSFTKPDGTQVYFRRAPESLYNNYKQALDDKGVDISKGIFVNETIYLTQYEGFAPTGARPQDRYFTAAHNQHAAKIGENAYQLWLIAGKPSGNVTSSYWLQLEKNFSTANGQGAYDFWVQAGRNTSGADSIWQQALDAHKPKIEARANQLWVAAGKTGNGPLPAHLQQAEKEYGDEIGTWAFDKWVKDGSKAGGSVSQHWATAQKTFETDRAKPAFDQWRQASMPGGEDNAAWTTARDNVVDELWAKDGKPVEIQVEIRAPWREDILEDVYMGDADGEWYSGRWRGSVGIGPAEGWRPHLDGEVTFLYPYNQPNVSTVRAGFPSPTQGWGVGIRQQDTTIWSQLRVGGGTASHNKQRVYDLTVKSTGEEWSIMDGRAYLAFGNRNRVRVDYAGKGTGAAATWKHDKSYVRIRETGFMELGLGVDFLKYAYGDENVSVNGYYELQLYAPDFRAQWNFGGNGDYTRGMQPLPPFFEIDPALQFSSTEPPRIAELPGEER